MATKSSNSNLHRAAKVKNDEFYTQRADIEKELKHYKDQFRDKIVYCNCDDPFESNFFKYFAANFNALGLKKLITTSYTM
jgi:ribosome-binding ATPase YchF (GTP1/OBG family)